jgi:esterase/lipase superfamily enzyme
MKALVERRHLPIWVDIWGTDVCHDWDWWYKQARYFMDKLL